MFMQIKKSDCSSSKQDSCLTFLTFEKRKHTKLYIDIDKERNI